MKQLVILTLIALFSLPAIAQKRKYDKPKDADKKGTLFFYWGYNRSFYSKSNLRFVGSGYDFTMGDAKAHDNPSKLGWHYFDPKRITVPQFNVRIGYYFKDNWAISFGYDHLKYIFADQNHVKLSGHIDPGVDNTTMLSGDYKDYDYTTDRNTFHYENSNGLNYLRFEITRSNQWYRTKGKGWFAFTTNIGASIGGLLSYNDFTFAGKKDMVTISMSGYGISGHLGLRFEFFRHVFLQANYGGGFMHQVKVRTRPDDKSAFARQVYGYMQMEAVIGALFYIPTKNNCGTCPTW
ncbi:MAG: hypothetical protein M9916_12090 [Crocinitomicaceae bacterium]|nr:hypothetical protein [Crocinitomicaceae bacterium]